MLERTGRFIGMMAADIANLFRGRQAVPCTVEWADVPATAWNAQRPERPIKPPTGPSGGSDAAWNAQREICCGHCSSGCWSE